MELDTLILLLFILAPVLSRLFRGKKKVPRSAPKPAPERLSGEREVTPFEEALRRIQEALTEGQVAEPAPKPESRVPTPRRERPRPIPATREEFRSKEKYVDPKFFDDAFDSASPSTDSGADEHYHEPLGTELDIATVGLGRKTRDMSRWRDALKNMVLLDEPRARSRWTPPSL